MATATIAVTQGYSDLIGGTLTDTRGNDISTDTIMMGLSAQSGVFPTTWYAPDVSAPGATSSSRVVRLLINNRFTVGTWWLWVWVQDGSTKVPLMFPQSIRIV